MRRPVHLARYQMEHGVVVAISPEVPEVYTSPTSGPSISGITF
jgi:hypothetical protein